MPPKVEKQRRQLSILRPEEIGIQVWRNVKKSRFTMLFNPKNSSGREKYDDDDDSGDDDSNNIFEQLLQ